MVKGKTKKADNTARIIFDKRDEFGSRRPIDVLSQCHPIMIIDEPQSVLGVDKGNKTRKGLALFKPLFTLLYSATHRKGDIYNMMFRLDAIDAYNQKLVKKIEVKRHQADWFDGYQRLCLSGGNHHQQGQSASSHQL